MSLARTFTALAALTFATACTDPHQERISAQIVTNTTKHSVSAHLTEISEAIELVGQATFFTDLDRILDPASTGPITGLEQSDIDEISTEIINRLFAQDTIESQSDTRVVYRVRGSHLCPNDAKCIAAFDAIGVFLDVTSSAPDALDIAVLIGEAELNPFTFHLDPARVSATVDVAAVRGSAELFAQYLDFDAAELPETALGRFTVSLAKNTAHDYTAALEIEETIDVESTHPDHPISVSIAAKSTPVITARLDGNTRRAYGTVDLASVDVAMPAAFLLEELTCSATEIDCGPFHGTLSAHLSGASANVELTASLDRLLFTGVGLGDDTSTVMLDQTRLIEVDVNAMYDRRFDVELSTFDDFVEAAITRALTVDVGLDLSNIADQIPDLPEWTGHDRLALGFAGNSPRIRMGDGGDHDLSGRPTTLIAQVLSGDLSFTSEQVPAVDVAGGQCLYVDHDAIESAHPFSALIAHSCP